MYHLTITYFIVKKFGSEAIITMITDEVFPCNGQNYSVFYETWILSYGDDLILCNWFLYHKLFPLKFIILRSVNKHPNSQRSFYYLSGFGHHH